MTHHLPMVWPSDTWPIGLVWTRLAALAKSGPTKRLAEISLTMWEDTTLLLARVDEWLFFCDVSACIMIIEIDTKPLTQTIVNETHEGGVWIRAESPAEELWIERCCTAGPGQWG